MKAYKKATFEDILADAKDNDKKVAFLKKLAKTKGLKDKNGEARAITYLELKRKYYEEFYEELLPVPQNPKKEKTFLDTIEEL